ncbi:hypothetical protein [Spirillospora sp. NPDC029432]|uniref:hypothetical protein n=1 Tax=Spirillospora sp. NPDC029432 TaxID=3154599 RepID=UPI003454B0D5
MVVFALLAMATIRDTVAVSALTACVFLFGPPIGALVDRQRPEVWMLVAALPIADLVSLGALQRCWDDRRGRR